MNRKAGAGSRGAYGLASIVDALAPKPSGSPASVGSARGLRLFPKMTGNMIMFQACLLGGHPESWTVVSEMPTICPRLLIAAGLPVISAQRRESHDVAVSPKETEDTLRCVPKAQKSSPSGSGTDVFGQADSFPAIVDPAIVGPTVLSSKRAEVDIESVDAYYRAATYNGRGGRSDGRG